MDNLMYCLKAYVGPPHLFEHPGKQMCHDHSPVLHFRVISAKQPLGYIFSLRSFPNLGRGPLSSA